MEALDTLIRFAVIGVLALAALRLVWGAALTRASVAMLMFALSVMAYMLCSSRAVFPALGPLQYLVMPGCTGLPFFFWWFSRALFDDGFRIRAWHGLLLALFLALGQWMAFGAPANSYLVNTAVLVLHHVIALALAFSAIYEAINSRASDLIESRRQLRLTIVIGAGVYILVVLSVELVFGNERAPEWLETLNVAGILALSLFLLPKLNRDLFAPPQVKTLPAPAEQPLLQALLAAMEQEKFYHEDGLTITALAERLSVQEYRLRRLINQHLGYRNFNAFLNHYRIEEARAQLADINLARIPVLTIAMDLGYRSLSPFNKAFKEITGVTPTEYRRGQLSANNLTDSEKTAAIPESI
jgi:AraC-like DNA-binding protein